MQKKSFLILITFLLKEILVKIQCLNFNFHKEIKITKALVKQILIKKKKKRKKRY